MRLSLLQRRRIVVGVGLALATSIAVFAVAQQVPTTSGTTPSPPTEAERFEALAKSLTGATLVGHFTVTGREDAKLTEERYELGEVKHVEGERWLIQARIKYGEHDVPLPLALPIRWAGDTPVICVDKVGFPGLGTYTARVMIYADHYAGFWSGGDHGGHLFGVVEHGAKPAASEPGTGR